MTNTCKKCLEVKLLDKFGKTPTGNPRGVCNACRVKADGARVKADPELRKRSAERTAAWKQRNPEAYKESMIRTKATNKESIKARDRATAARKRADPETYEKMKESNRRWAAANADYIRESNKAYYEANKDAIKAQVRSYLDANPDKAKAWGQNYRARKRSAGVLTGDIVRRVYAAPECFYCEQPFTQQRTPTLDHVVPLSQQGLNEESNLVACCRSCNSSKNDRRPDQWGPPAGRSRVLEKLREKGLTL